MKITDIKTVYVDYFMYVQVYTDEGIVGLGEGGAWGVLEASGRIVEAFTPYLIGMDPLNIEHIWQYIYRCNHFRGAAMMGAISAIDIALWDISGKYYGVPIHKLLGGKTRDKARCYIHVKGENMETLLAEAKSVKERGYTAIGHLSPFMDVPRDESYFETYVQRIDRAVGRVAAYREAVGDGVDLCLELHRRMKPAEAIDFAREIEQYRPMYIEDPTTPDNIDSMAHIASKINIPLATGERLHTIQEFSMLLKRDAADYARTCLGLCGGISGAKKIAALAEANGVGIIPHSAQSTSNIITAASLHLDACISNFAIQELPRDPSFPLYQDITTTQIQRDGAFLIIPDGPGLGFELHPDAAQRLPYKPKQLITRRHVDGSIYDD